MAFKTTNSHNTVKHQGRNHILVSNLPLQKSISVLTYFRFPLTQIKRTILLVLLWKQSLSLNSFLSRLLLNAFTLYYLHSIEHTIGAEHGNQFLNLFQKQNIVYVQLHLHLTLHHTTSINDVPHPAFSHGLKFYTTYCYTHCWWMEQLKCICTLDSTSYPSTHQKGFQSC